MLTDGQVEALRIRLEKRIVLSQDVARLNSPPFNQGFWTGKIEAYADALNFINEEALRGQ